MYSTAQMKVTVVFDNRNFVFHFDRMSTSMRQVKRIIFAKYGVPVDEQILYDYQSRDYTPLLNDLHSLSNLKVQTDGIKILMVEKNIQTSINIKVEFKYSSNSPLQFHRHKLCTISQLKDEIAKRTGFASEQLQLDDDGRVLRDDLNFFQSHLRDECTINCSLKDIIEEDLNKEEIAERTGFPSEQLELDDGGKILHDDLNFFQPHLQDECTINSSLKDVIEEDFVTDENMNIDDIDILDIEEKLDIEEDLNADEIDYPYEENQD